MLHNSGRVGFSAGSLTERSHLAGRKQGLSSRSENEAFGNVRCEALSSVVAKGEAWQRSPSARWLSGRFQPFAAREQRLDALLASKARAIRAEGDFHVPLETHASFASMVMVALSSLEMGQFALAFPAAS